MQAKYRVAITGLRDGYAREQVVGMLATLFKSGAEQIERGLNGPGGIVLNTPDLEAARRYQALLSQRGCVCRIVPDPDAPPAAAAPPVVAAATPADPVRRVRDAAEQGQAAAQAQLALRYRTGEGVPRDMAQAIAWYRKAAEQGDAAAQFALAEIYVKGPEVAQDFVEAAAWAKRAAAQGHADAQNYLAVMYDNGDGLPRDPERALLWYRKAAAQGQAKARARLAALEPRELHVPAAAAVEILKSRERRFGANYQGLGLLIRWVGILGVLVILIGYAKWHQLHPTKPTPPTAQTLPELPRIQELIGDDLAEGEMICKRGGPFPYDTRTPPEGSSFAGGGWHAFCRDCDALVDAGLLSRTAYEAQGDSRAGVVYQLTELGRPLYRDEVRDLDGQSAGARAWRDKQASQAATNPFARAHEPGLCFADKVVLHEISEALPPMQLSATRYISIKYVVEAVNPSPLMGAPAFRSLKLPLPAPDVPALYEPQIVTYTKSLITSDEGSLDPGFRYGKWALPELKEMMRQQQQQRQERQQQH